MIWTHSWREFFQRAPCPCWQAGAETDSVKWLKASISIAACQDWVEQVAEVKTLRKKNQYLHLFCEERRTDCTAAITIVISCEGLLKYLSIFDFVMVVLTCRLVHYFPWFNLWRLRKEEESLAARGFCPGCLFYQTVSELRAEVTQAAVGFEPVFGWDLPTRRRRRRGWFALK